MYKSKYLNKIENRKVKKVNKFKLTVPAYQTMRTVTYFDPVPYQGLSRQTWNPYQGARKL